MKELDVLTDAFWKASRSIRGMDRCVHSKACDVGMYDVVTDCDVVSELSIIESIHQEFPDDRIISEETNPDGSLEGRVWAIDPIDGTMNFSRGIPLYSMQGVFMVDGVPKASAIYMPFFDDMYTASDEGAFLNGKPMHTACPRPLKKCILACGDSSKRNRQNREAQALIFSKCYDDVARFKVFGASSVDFAYLASGKVDLHIRFLNHIWDYMPGIHLAVAAGAVYDRKLVEDHRILVLCSSKEVLDEAVGTLVPKFISCFRRP